MTAQQQNGWTVTTLKTHFDGRFAELSETVNKADKAFEKCVDSTSKSHDILVAQQATFVTKEQVRWFFMALLGGGALAVAIFAAVSGGV